MALDGMVYKTEMRGDQLVVFLAPYEHNSGTTSIPGQLELIIENPTYIPKPGDILWGGSDSARLSRGNGKDELRYRRKGYTRLAEDFNS